MKAIVNSLLFLLVLVCQLTTSAYAAQLESPQDGLLVEVPMLFEWSSPPAQKYHIVIRDAVTKEVFQNQKTQQLSIEPNFEINLTRRYEWRVRSRVDGSWGSYTSWREFFFAQLPETVPDRPVASPSSWRELIWDPVDSAIQYQVQIYNSNLPAKIKKKVTEPVYPIADPTIFGYPDELYLEWRVRARNAAGWSRYSGWQTVLGNQPPVVSITAPETNTTILDSQLIAFNGSASDLEQGDLSSEIEWGSDLIGELLGVGSTINVDLPVGQHVITATVRDSESKTSADTVIVNVIEPLSIRQLMAVPSSIVPGMTTTISWSTTGADTVSLSDGQNILSIELSGDLIVSPAQSTTYELVAQNSTELISRTETVLVSTPSTISLLSPSTNESVKHRAPVVGVFDGEGYLGVRISHGEHQLPACTYQNNFYVNNFEFDFWQPLEPLTATLSDFDGAVATFDQRIYVSRDIPRVRVNRDCDIGSFHSTFRIRNADSPLVGIDLDNDGIVDEQFQSPPSEYTIEYSEGGLFEPTFYFEDDVTETLYIVSKLESDIQRETEIVMSELYSRMGAADVEGTLKLFASQSRDKYSSIFANLDIGLDELVGQFSSPTYLEGNGDQIEYVINRTINGVDRSFFVLLVRDLDGLWRIVSL